ncbi:hypothetical protein ACOACO_16675 [Nocardioides sp. CPCC 205120]|uniref:hypothetical protein n=1 Tax=Nocardioides sp. CPCC 205120 TaxID=3406462 RepID=UPI003B500A14
MTTTRRVRRTLAGVGAAAALALVPTVAHAATIVPIEYDAVGTSTIAKTDSTVALGPTTLRTDLDVDTGDFTGSLPLPGTRTNFKAAGFLPVQADVAFVEAAPLTGHINLSGDIASVSSTATYNVRLSNIKIAGFPTFTGTRCQTKVPVTIPVGTEPGVGFDLAEGGRLVGEYTIGDFANCGLNTGLINLLVPGPGNTVDIQVSNGVFL